MTKILNFDEERSKKTTTLDLLTGLVQQDLLLVNQIIVQEMQSEVTLIPKLAGHIVASGGKRLRPMLTLAAAKLCEYNGNRHVKLAACVEFIHTATLLHDDVVDDSSLRRGVETANTLWGNEASVLVGDFLFSRAFQIMVQDGSLEVLKILSHASAVIAEGEVHQLLTTNDVATSEDTYLDIIKAKTAALFSASCRIGAVVAQRLPQYEEALASYGKNLGIAFQLVDDALDYGSNSGSFGKLIGDDFREGKITLPVILAFRRGSNKERKFWERTLQLSNQKKPDLDYAISLIHKHNSFRDTIQRALHYGAKAKDALAIFPDNETKNLLLDLVEFCIDRTH